MRKEFVATQLDVLAFAQDGAQLSGADALRQFSRLQAEAPQAGDTRTVRWTARGEQRAVRGAATQIWLHLQAQVVLPLTCQRCLGPVDVTVQVDRSFRFVADEATAEAEDDEAEEDLLAVSRSFDLQGLIEDELLMEMPVVPRHAQCPADVKLAVADPEFEAQQAAKPNPFAVLHQLKTDKGNQIK